MGLSNLPDKEFKIIKMLSRLERMDKLRTSRKRKFLKTY